MSRDQDSVGASRPARFIILDHFFEHLQATLNTITEAIKRYQEHKGKKPLAQGSIPAFLLQQLNEQKRIGKSILDKKNNNPLIAGTELFLFFDNIKLLLTQNTNKSSQLYQLLQPVKLFTQQFFQEKNINKLNSLLAKLNREPESAPEENPDAAASRGSSIAGDDQLNEPLPVLPPATNTQFFQHRTTDDTASHDPSHVASSPDSSPSDSSTPQPPLRQNR